MQCSLADQLEEHRSLSTLLPLQRALEICADIAAGLSHLHPAVVHRDLKPHNVLLDFEGVAKVRGLRGYTPHGKGPGKGVAHLCGIA